MCRKFAIKILEEKGEVRFSCNGNSMRPTIAPKETIYIKKIHSDNIRPGDACFVRVNGNLQVHFCGAIDKNRFKIQNAKGFVNGWVGANSIFGVAIQVEDRVLISQEELEKREKERLFNAKK